MENEFVTYEQALALKELGFDEYCLGGFCKIKSNWTFYINEMGCDLPAPLKQQTLRWFRDKHNLIGCIEGGYTDGKNCFAYVIWNEHIDDWTDDIWNTYEEAEKACIDKLIEIAKQNGKV